MLLGRRGTYATPPGWSRVAQPTCPVARGVSAALADARAAYDARGVIVAAVLEPESGLRAADDIVYWSVYTIFRGLPARLAPGAVLRVTSQPRAGGDVELTWDADEDADEGVAPSVGTPAEALATGPYGDLFGVALLALESVCRARGGLMERRVGPPASSSLLRATRLHRRYMFLVPSAEREPYAPGKG